MVPLVTLYHILVALDVQSSDPDVTAVILTSLDVDLDHSILLTNVLQETELAHCLPRDVGFLHLFEVCLRVAHADGDALGHVAVICGVDVD